MGSIEETPEEAKNERDAPGRRGQTGLIGSDYTAPAGGNKANQDIDDDDSYDNDFEPFETSKKDFYQLDSVESKTQKTESAEAASAR